MNTGSNVDQSILTARLEMRSPQLADAAHIVVLANNEYIATAADLPYPYLHQDAVKWIAAKSRRKSGEQYLHYVIILADTKLIIGTVTVVLQCKLKQAELGYWIGEPYWNNGYATEAVTAVVTHLLKDPGILRVYCRVALHNEASIKVLSKVGFHCDTVLLSECDRQGRLRDIAIYVLSG